jgi:hypothetical protein
MQTNEPSRCTTCNDSAAHDRIRIAASLLLLLFITAFPQASHGQISGWDDGTDQGWVLGSDATGAYSRIDSGGNPGGYIRFYDTADDGRPDLLASEAYSGDYRLLGPGAAFEWDIRASAGTSGDGLRIELSGPGGTALFSDTRTVSTQWHHFSAPLESQYWSVTSGTWETLIADVTRVWLDLDIQYGQGYDGCLDNFAIVSPCGFLPIPVDPRTTYVRTCCSYDTPLPRIVAINEFCAQPGEWLRVTSYGNYSADSESELENGAGVLALFSSSDEFLSDPDELNRVRRRDRRRRRLCDARL